MLQKQAKKRVYFATWQQVVPTGRCLDKKTINSCKNKQNFSTTSKYIKDMQAIDTTRSIYKPRIVVFAKLALH